MVKEIIVERKKKKENLWVKPFKKKEGLKLS